MIHLGDITKISGYTAPIVDVVAGGSPCQDLSQAGKRAGFNGERSVLFLDQTRIVKEMREHDREIRGDIDVRPRYMVWENVPGAFSSNEAEDFRKVLQETARIADQNAVIPQPPKGKWTTSGCVMGDGWSIAWRVLDAQFYGTPCYPLPQRRRRIALVADFGGRSAPEILFIRKSVSGNIEPGEPPRKDTRSDIERGTGVYDREKMTNSKGISKKNIKGVDCYNLCETGQVGRTLTTSSGGLNEHIPVIIECFDAYNQVSTGDKAKTLTAERADNEHIPIVYGKKDVFSFYPQQKAESQCFIPNVSNTLVNGTCPGFQNAIVTRDYIVRRLTPLECERLQGYPDGWTDIGEYMDSKGKKKKTSDSARYKALGNSIAIPPWKWIMKRISACYERDATLASLFDGIGGFPYIWEQLNRKGSCLWASEIEEFPIAVTKVRIGE